MGQCGHAGEKKGQEKEKEEEEEGNGDGRMTCGWIGRDNDNETDGHVRRVIESGCNHNAKLAAVRRSATRCAAAQQRRLCRLAEGTLWPCARLQPASGGNAGHARETSAIRLGQSSCGGASQM
uniref:Uncharacterized protein n=1 Tax=Oryza glumipatula TaxID=40148 RepID=A0A0E0AQ50_9ORYZ